MSNRRRLSLEGQRFTMTERGLLVAESPRTLRRGKGDGLNLVRNREGKPLLCCHGPCTKNGNDHIRIMVPHNAPRFEGEQLVYIFCSELCRQAFAKGTHFEPYL